MRCPECDTELRPVRMPTRTIYGTHDVLPRMCHECARMLQQADRARVGEEFRQWACERMGITMERYPLHPVLSWWLEGGMQGAVWLTGPNRVGKTMQMQSLAHVLIDRACEEEDVPEMRRALPVARYRTESEIIRDCKPRDGHDPHEALDYWCEVPVLLVDECGLKSGTRHDWEVWTAILDARRRHWRATVFASNASPKYLREEMKHPLYDTRNTARIAEMVSRGRYTTLKQGWWTE